MSPCVSWHREFGLRFFLLMFLCPVSVSTCSDMHSLTYISCDCCSLVRWDERRETHLLRVIHSFLDFRSSRKRERGWTDSWRWGSTVIAVDLHFLTTASPTGCSSIKPCLSIHWIVSSGEAGRYVCSLTSPLTTIIRWRAKRRGTGRRVSPKSIPLTHIFFWFVSSWYQSVSLCSGESVFGVTAGHVYLKQQQSISTCSHSLIRCSGSGEKWGKEEETCRVHAICVYVVSDAEFIVSTGGITLRERFFYSLLLLFSSPTSHAIQNSYSLPLEGMTATCSCVYDMWSSGCGKGRQTGEGILSRWMSNASLGSCIRHGK